MVDFRYHALSLIAVLAALAIGLLLGVSIGDAGLVSSADRALRSDVQRAAVEARDEAARLREELGRRDAYEERTLPALVGERLGGRRIAILFLHDPRGDAFEPVRTAIEASGAELAWVASLREPVDLAALGEAAGGTRYSRVAEDPELVEPLGRRLGTQLVTGGQLVREARRELLASSSGAFDGVEGVVLVRGEPPERGDDEFDPGPFVEALVEGLQSYETPVAGVERTDTEPSQVAWYEARELPSVDNVDEPSGQASLVMALAGSADGAYGIKASADALVPEALTGP